MARMAATKKVRSPNSHATMRKKEWRKAGMKPFDEWIVFCMAPGRKLMRELMCSGGGRCVVVELSASGAATGEARYLGRLDRRTEAVSRNGRDAGEGNDIKCIEMTRRVQMSCGATLMGLRGEGGRGR